MIPFLHAMRGLCWRGTTQDSLLKDISKTMEAGLKGIPYRRLEKLANRLIDVISKEAQHLPSKEGSASGHARPFAEESYGYQLPVLRTIAQRFAEDKRGIPASKINLRLFHMIPETESELRSEILTDIAAYTPFIPSDEMRYQTALDILRVVRNRFSHADNGQGALGCA